MDIVSYYEKFGDKHSHRFQISPINATYYVIYLLVYQSNKPKLSLDVSNLPEVTIILITTI